MRAPERSQTKTSNSQILFINSAHGIDAETRNRGVYGLATIMGITDVDPFILGMTQAAGSATVLSVGAAAIVIAAATNNLVKGVYAYAFADRRTGVRSLISLAALALLGLLSLVWILR